MSELNIWILKGRIEMLEKEGMSERAEALKPTLRTCEFARDLPAQQFHVDQECENVRKANDPHRIKPRPIPNRDKTLKKKKDGGSGRA